MILKIRNGIYTKGSQNLECLEFTQKGVSEGSQNLHTRESADILTQLLLDFGGKVNIQK